MFAWGDILEGIEKDIEFEHNPPPEFRKFKGFIDSRKE
jgi:hypothetical protein